MLRPIEGELIAYTLGSRFQKAPPEISPTPPRHGSDPAASRLAAGQTRTITAVIPHLRSWYLSTIVAGTEVPNHRSVRIDDELVGRTAADLFVSLGPNASA